MTEKENFLRVVKNMYDTIKPLTYLDDFSKIDKLKELNRWTTEFLNQTENIEKMLESYIMLGLINSNDKNELIESIKEINGEYLKN
ncbi:hypothetical protein [Flavobacterium chungangense]|uniref:Uncharacterized protein n=1 Tax=Flavobacterium chungangense TaxID=554283 RepID=A0A6V6ZD41_9FLAO|nr:hypothetical protein [Flavobacterium chungangense]CAD0009698.1 hypothetical protein FLACHUCJ7_04363 [Flavobacterium chungangense]